MQSGAAPSPSTREEILTRISSLNTWSTGGKRAPHKPLLLLLALGRLQRSEPRLVTFSEIEQRLSKLLEEFGPPSQSLHPEYPFYHLQNDQLWTTGGLPAQKTSASPTKGTLRRYEVQGGFPPTVEAAFRKDPVLLREAAQQLLDEHFPRSIHADILAAVGLDIDPAPLIFVRAPDFRPRVLSAYDHTCAFCGGNVFLGRAELALDAAHIRWHALGGPSERNNGLACCPLHHRAFDRGAITVSDDLRIAVSNDLHGSGTLFEELLALAGRPLRQPNLRDALPLPAHLAWHRKEVFRPPSRDMTASPR